MKTIVPISGVFGNILPSEWIAPLSEALDFIGVNIGSSYFVWDKKGMSTHYEIHILEHIEFDFPLVPGSTIEFEGDDSGIIVQIKTYPVFQVVIQDITFTFSFSSDILKAYSNETEDRQWAEVKNAEGEVVGFSVNLILPELKADADGNINFESPKISMANSAFMISDTGVLLDFSADSGESTDLPPFQLIFEGVPEELQEFLPEDFKGFWINRLSIFYIKDGANLPSLTFERAAFGSGGFTGIVGLGSNENAERTFTEGQLNTLETNADGIWVGDIAGMRVVLLCFNIEFLQSLPTASRIAGYMFMPFADKWLRLEASIGGPDGEFMMELGGAGDAGLIDLDNEMFQIIVNTIRYELRKNELDESVHYAIINGSLQPKIGDFDWPTLEVERMSVSSEGDIDIEGGWINVPETFSLDFHGFRIDIDQVGMGNEEEGARQWFGFSGGITLVEGIPLSASVQGLKFSWNTSGDTDLRVSLEGIAVHLEIPDTLILDGSVRFQELERPPATRPAESADTLSESTGVFGSVFTGSVMLNITALKTQVSGELLIGDLTQYSYNDSGELVVGEKFTAFYIVLDAQLPTAIPLGATGTGLYGLTGLFGMHMAPDRQMIEEEPESWYLWYKNKKNNVERSDYNVTKVVKWGPQFDHFAFGAGLSIGTIYDDGFTINVGALVVILVPGPVVMIEGRANLLKQRGEGGGRSAEGALYALIVFDGIAETFQMNVDINYTLEDVITVGGGMEAFFDFKDSTRWYIYIGRKEPEEKRIRAEVISIITASSYFMIDPGAIQFGAAVGINLDYEYGPLEVRIILRLRFEIALFLKEPQLTGLVELYLEITVKIFGIGLGLIAQALLEGSAPQPWWIHGLARFAVSLPFPLPSFDAQVEFTWGESGQPARVDLLKGAYMIHPKQSGTSWTLSTDPGTQPIIPVDAIPILSCGKPISGVSTYSEEGVLKKFTTETVEGWEFGYDILSLELYEGESETPLLSMLGEDKPWLNELGSLYQLPVEDNQGEQVAQTILEPQIKLWDYSPLSALHPESQKRYIDLCDTTQQSPQMRCIHWQDVPLGTSYPVIFSYKGVTFVTPIGQAAASVGGPQNNRGLNANKISLHFPEPIVWLNLFVDDSAQITCYYQGEVVSHSGSTNVYEITAADTVDITLRGRVVQSDIIYKICYITQREDERLWRGTGEPDGSNRTAMFDTPMLKADTSYRLEVKTQRTEKIIGGTEGTGSSQDATYYFRTAKAPGLNLDSQEIQEKLKLGRAVPEGANAIDFRDSSLNRLDTYLARTIPGNGSTLFYHGYKVLIEFNEPYIQNFYGEGLRLRIKDRNGRTLLGVEDDSISWLDSALPLLTPGLLAVLQAPRQQECANQQVDWQQFNKQYLSCLLSPATVQPKRMYSVEVVFSDRVLYQFEFSTSAYRTIIDHLESGLPHDEHGNILNRNQLVRRRLPRSEQQPVTDWATRLQELQDAVAEARRQLWFAITWSTERNKTISEAQEEMKKAREALHRFCVNTYTWLDQGGNHPDFPALRYSGVQPLFEAVELGHRPLPPKIELVQFETGDPAKYFLLLESPEPLDWQRLRFKSEANLALRSVWNEDQTRAFIFSNSRNGLFDPGVHRFLIEYDRGGADSEGINSLDLEPLYKEGETDLGLEVINWSVELVSS